MKNKGFTLIELLGVIMILAILSLITFPPLLDQIKKSKQEIKSSTQELIIDAAKDYYEDNINAYEKVEGMTYCIDINTLTDNGYLNKKIKDENINDISNTQKVKMIYHNNKFDYDVVNSCTNNLLARNNIEVPIVTEDSGLYKSQTDEGRYIYRGGDPINNWIELNEGTEQSPNYVKYRIISFEQDGTIKVVRNLTIGHRAWDEESNNRNNDENLFCKSSGTYYGCNVWGNQNNTYLEGNKLDTFFSYKYYRDNTENEMRFTSTEKSVTKDSSINTYLNGTWLQEKKILGKYIIQHDYYVGGINYYSGYSGGDKGIVKEKQEEQILIWNGKIGLQSITESVESSIDPSCTSVYSNYYYAKNSEGKMLKDNLPESGWPCKKTYNWLVGGARWTITAVSSNNYQVWTISDLFGQNGPKFDNTNTHPAFYLKPDISLTGEGSETNPYRIVGES